MEKNVKEGDVKMNSMHKQTLLRLLRNLGKHKYIYLASIVCATAGRALFNVTASYMLKLITQMAQMGTTDGLGKMIMINFSIGVTMLLLWRFGIIRYNIEAKRGIAILEKQVFIKAMKLPMSYYENTHSGDFMSKVMFDAGKAGDVYGSRLRRLVAPILSVSVYLIPMFMLSVELTVVLLLVSIVMLMVNVAFVRPMKALGIELSKDNAKMTESLTNILSGIELSKIFGIEGSLIKQYQESNESYFKVQKKKNLLSAWLEGINGSFNLLSALVFLGIGLWFISNKRVTLSSLTAIYAMYGPFCWEFLQIGRYMPELTNCLANADRLFEFLDSEEEPQKYDVPGAYGKGYIVFEDVTFAYDSDRKVLNQFSLTVDKGKTVAITGKSGRGKSTLAKVLLGFYKPQSGRISIDGKSYESMSLEEIRDMIAYVPQEPYLYGVSIARNIAYGKPEASKEEIIAAAKMANAHEFIQKLEEGYDTIPGERGNRLSGGERQRIAIARAILKDAPILLLDEATSALDNDSERLVSEAIDHLAKGKTTIMIAHRPATIARADVVVSM